MGRLELVGDDDVFNELESTFVDFEAISGLALNIKKTVMVPLFRFNVNTVRARLAELAPSWGALDIQGKAEYLGFVVGPQRGEESWKAPLRKFAERAAAWAKLGLGFR